MLLFAMQIDYRIVLSFNMQYAIVRKTEVRLNCER